MWGHRNSQVAARGGLGFSVVSVVAAVALLVTACTPSPTTPEVSTLPESSFAWNQAELELGLANWDDVFPGREVPRGTVVRELPSGDSLSSFSDGGTFEDELDRFIAEQKVAGLIVVHEGKVRLERYGLGHTVTGRWTSQSMAKSFTSTLVGAAVKDGFISSIDDRVTTYIPDLAGSAYDEVTIRHLMTMTSGVRWNEDYTDPTSDIAQFYAVEPEPGIDATVSYMRGLERESEPGTQWVYKTGETHLLGVLVSSATGQRLSEYLSSKIWQPYGMEQSASWSIDRTDHELAGCCLQATLRDYARYGQLVLEEGRIDGRSIVPEGWFEEATRTQVEFGVDGRGYGYQWWTADDQTFSAIGIHGQLIHIDRERELVVVLNSAWPTATDPTRSSAQGELLSAIRAAIDDGLDRP
jgi:CubicO group peptidase (beta-lactamase class C family)